MTDTPIRITLRKLRTIYGIGILVFSAIVGFITLLVIFLQNLKLS